MTVVAEIPAATGSVRQVAATGETDDRGQYRLAGLSAGRFLVSVSARAPAIGSGGTLLDEEKTRRQFLPLRSSCLRAFVASRGCFHRLYRATFYAVFTAFATPSPSSSIEI